MSNTVKLVVTVQAPVEFDLDAVDLAGYLSKFIQIGLSDLEDSVADDDIESSEEEEAVASQVTWGKVEYLYGIGKE